MIGTRNSDFCNRILAKVFFELLEPILALFFCAVIFFLDFFFLFFLFFLYCVRSSFCRRQ